MGIKSVLQPFGSRSRRPRYRPQVLALEERLPPGDAVFAGLLAFGLIPERTAGHTPAVSPGQARRVADPGLAPAGAEDSWLLTESTDQALAPSEQPRLRGGLAPADPPTEDSFARPPT